MVKVKGYFPLLNFETITKHLKKTENIKVIAKLTKYVLRNAAAR